MQLLKKISINENKYYLCIEDDSFIKHEKTIDTALKRCEFNNNFIIDVYDKSIITTTDVSSKYILRVCYMFRDMLTENSYVLTSEFYNLYVSDKNVLYRLWELFFSSYDIKETLIKKSYENRKTIIGR